MAEGQGQLVLSHPLGLELPRPGSVPILQMREPAASQILEAQGSARKRLPRIKLYDLNHHSLSSFPWDLRAREESHRKPGRRHRRVFHLLFDHLSASVKFLLVYFIETSQKQILGRFVQPWPCRRGPSWQAKAWGPPPTPVELESLLCLFREEFGEVVSFQAHSRQSGFTAQVWHLLVVWLSTAFTSLSSSFVYKVEISLLCDFYET